MATSCSIPSQNNFSTITELILQRAINQPDNLIYTFLADGDNDALQLTYGELEYRSRLVGGFLQNFTQAGERALLLFHPGLDYIVSFFGCLFAEIIAVPAYPPHLKRLNRTLPRLETIIKSASPSVVLTTSTILQSVLPLIDEIPIFRSLRWIATDNISDDFALKWKEPSINGSTLAFLQYTSGSTGAPKGVMLSHSNLMHNSACIQDCFGTTPNSLGMIWVPPYHDMGLIGGIIQPVYGGFPVVLMSPVAFANNPYLWLKAISKYQATISGGPNFAYDLCARKIANEQCVSLDLSSWEVAFCGAEPVRQETIDNFSKVFEPYGFRRNAFLPCYGLAEATLIVSGNSKMTSPSIRSLKRSALEKGVVEDCQEPNDQISLVSCGKSVGGNLIHIVLPQSMTRLPSDQVGEIWLSGLSVARGYWNQEAETAQTFHARIVDSGAGPFLRTGDLGFIQNNELFITGRLKDLIIIRGHNHYPQDIELTVEQSHPALRPGNGAAFSIDINGEERLVIAYELERNYQRNPDIVEIARAVRHSVAEQHDIHVYGIVLLPIGGIPKTSSGKIQRHACKESFINKTLSIVASNFEDILWGVDVPVDELLTREAILNTKRENRQQLLLDHLRGQIARALRLDPSMIDVQQPLNALGMDSLMAVELKHNLENNLGMMLSVVDLLSDLSISQLASKLADVLFPNPTNVLLNVVTTNQIIVADHPLSYGQRALWFIHQLAPESAAYNIASTIRIRADLDITALKESFQKLVSRHSALRTTFANSHGEPVQIIHNDMQVCFDVIHADDWSETYLNKFLVEEAHRPFDLEVGPLLRVKLVVLSEHEYILLLVIHHIVADLWSLVVLVEELSMLYSAERNGSQTYLAPLQIQYTDYARWQVKMLASVEGERLWAYWQTKLAGTLPTLNLPTDRPRPSTQTYSGAQFSFRLNETITKQVRIFAQSKGVTLYVVLLAAFQVLLSRYTGQDDIVVGSPAANRNQSQFANMIGYFVNPIALRADLSGNPTFDDFVEQVHATVLGGLEHQEFPFALLVERLWPERDPSHSPLFQVMFTLQKAHKFADKGLSGFIFGEQGTQLRLGELNLEAFSLEQHASQFDITLTMIEVGEQLLGSLQYNTDLFDIETITRLAQNYQALVGSIVSDSRQRISSLPLLTEKEKHQLLTEWNNTYLEYPKDICIHHLFENQVKRTPESLAVVFQEKQLSYCALNERANRVAHYLLRLGIDPDTRVGIFMEPSIEMMVGLFGILKSGGAYVPLDTNHPAKRLSYMLDNAQITTVLTQEYLKVRLPFYNGRIICLDSEWEMISKESDENPNSGVTTDNLSHVIYTSGSSGRPKGVMVHHRSVVNLWTAIYQSIYSQFGSRKLRIGLLAPLSFDGSIREYLTLSVGHTLHILPSEFRIAGVALLEYTKGHAIDELYCTPSQLKILISNGLLNGSDSFPSLILLGGEPIGSSLWQLLAEYQKITFYNIYGPTECTVDSTLCRILPAESSPVIGRPIANTQIYILDQELQPVPIGVPGQIFIGGVGLARGYVGRPDLTAENFIPNPFSSDLGARLYKTGDLARYRLDGAIEFLGRIDNQVKIRGFTVDLGEVESVLSSYPCVKESVVIVREDLPDEKQLVAYLTIKQNSHPTTMELRSYLREYLPSYMVPAVFIIVNDFPLTNNGKIDLQSLPKPDRVRPELDNSIEIPNTSVEKELANIWINVLGIEQVGIDDNFFELGGTSLSIIRVQSLIEELFKCKLPVVKLFKYPTIRLLADYLTKDQDEIEPSIRLERSRIIAGRRKELLDNKRSKRN